MNANVSNRRKTVVHSMIISRSNVNADVNIYHGQKNVEKNFHSKNGIQIDVHVIVSEEKHVHRIFFSMKRLVRE